MNRSVLAILAILSLAFVACGSGGGSDKSGPTTYTISGKVMLDGIGYPGVSIELSGMAAGATSTDASGNYAFEGLENGFYIVTPSLNAHGYTQNFDNSSLNPVILDAHSTGNNFNVLKVGINGQVTMNGSGYPGVTVTLGGDDTDSTVTDASGNYSFSVINGDYTVTASLSGQTFDPPAGYFPSIDGFESNNNDFALDTYLISGNVTREGFGYEGALVSLSGDATDTDTTDGSGYYSFSVLSGTYTVTPAVTGQGLTPDPRTIVVTTADSPNNDFALIHYTVSGQVTHNLIGYEAAELRLSGTSASGETYTDVLQYSASDGSYSFTVLNGTYTVTPTVTGQSLTPPSRAPIGVIGTNSTGNDFALNTYSISGQVTIGVGNTPYEAATVNLSGDEFSSTATNASGNYSFTGLLNGDYVRQ
jgi:inhibitor of cysteine peptidase